MGDSGVPLQNCLAPPSTTAAGPADARVRSVRWGERFARVEVCEVRLEPRASLFRWIGDSILNSSVRADPVVG